MTSASHHRSRAFALLAVLAPALGGSTELWARGVLLLATAAVLLAWPPRRFPGVLWTSLALALAVLGAGAFLPEAWTTPPIWRRLLTGTFEVPLPPMRSPQPWLTLEGAGLYWSALVFATALLSHHWEREERHRAARTYALGIVILAALAVGSMLAKWHVPWWPRPLNSGIEFGFFPNRNQTANVLALAGVMVTALGFESLSRQRKAGFAWFAGLALIGAALVLAYSRAGIALFFGGMAAWVGLSLRFSASRKGPTLAFAAVVALLTLFFLFGGDTLARFQRAADVPAGDYRQEIQRDAWRLAASQPWLGVGMGNFEPIFAVTRSYTSNQSRALHPESDWLWAAVELGWPAVTLLAVALAWWLAETLPMAAGTDRRLRSAAAVCGVAFVLHGLVDVSGHRAGSLWPALFLFSLARHPRCAGAERPWVAPVFRMGALLLAAFGAWWVASATWPAKFARWPTTATLAWLEKRFEVEAGAENYPAAMETVNAALRIAPVRWELFHQRAVAHAATPGGIAAAAADFDTARFLEPRWVEPCLEEGRIWLALDEPALALDAWKEALRRAGSGAPALYNYLISLGWSKIGTRKGLAEIAQTDPELLLTYLAYASGLDFEIMAGRFLDRDPALRSLAPAQRKRFFDHWFQRGDAERAVAMIVAHPEWQGDAWLRLAQFYGRKGDVERAWRFVERYGPPPALPQIASAQSLAELERAVHLNPDDIQKGLELYTALRTLRQNEEALATLHAVDRIAGRPPYVPYLEAAMWAEKGDWAKAWEAWQRYAVAAGIQ